MRIALFIYSIRGGGAQHRVLTLANGFAERGHTVDLVVIATDESVGVTLHPDVRVVALEQGWRHLFERLNRRINLRGLFTACAIPALARYLRTERPDILLSGATRQSGCHICTSLLQDECAARSARKQLPLGQYPLVAAVRAGDAPIAALHTGFRLSLGRPCYCGIQGCRA